MATNDSLFGRLKKRAGQLQKETYALFLAYRDPRTPWYARLLALLVVGYALSPIDLIPDFIPVVGYLDDLIIVPAGIALTLKLVPAQVMTEARETAARSWENNKKVGRVGAVIIIVIWLVILGAAILLGVRIYQNFSSK